ncbi:hypothetical protein GGF32_001088 [Allomyces javanicus]|nr:hypothetical protein GGF32_001088 [Allomyces javanicus]
MSSSDLFALGNADIDQDVRSSHAFKKYSAAMERVLATFDSIAEWPDMITFLSRLAKTIQSFPSPPNVPGKLLVSKRLAQCLNPALPAGVHQKAIETYSVVFDVLGPEKLASDATIWTFGLFPYFAFAPMSVKPALLTLVEKYFVTLGHLVLPVLSGLLMALLPGLEEEDNEFFEPTLAIIDKVQHSIDTERFYHSLWTCVLTAAPARRTGLTYLTKRQAMIRGSPPLVVKALAVCFHDRSQLVQRSALDLLLARYPLHRVSAECNDDDLRFLTNEVLKVALHRDMSLNRRLYAWVQGEEEDYFRAHSQDLIVQCLRMELESMAASRMIPSFKVLTSLLDKQVVGGPILAALLPTTLDILFNYHLQPQAQQDARGAPSDFHHTMGTAAMFFEVLDATAVWREIHVRLDQPPDEINLEWVHFTLQWGNLDVDDTRRIHVPMVILHVVELLVDDPDRPDFAGLVRLIASLCEHLDVPTSGPEIDLAPDHIRRIYSEPGSVFLVVPMTTVTHALERLLFVLVQHHRPDLEISSISTILGHLAHVPHDPVSFLALLGTTSVSVAQSLLRLALNLPTDTLSPHVTVILDLLIAHLAHHDAVVHDQAVDLIWRVLSLDPAQLTTVVDTITARMHNNAGFDAFGVFWRYSQERSVDAALVMGRPLLTVLTALQSRATRRCAERWISTYLASYTYMLIPLMQLLEDPLIARDEVVLPFGVAYNYRHAVDYNLLDHGFVLLGSLFEIGQRQLHAALVQPDSHRHRPYLATLLDVSSLFLASFAPDGATVSEQNAADQLQLVACDCFARLIAIPESQPLLALTNPYQRRVIAAIFRAIERGVLELQVKLLGTLKALLIVPSPTASAAPTAIRTPPTMTRSGAVLGSNLDLTAPAPSPSPMSNKRDSASDADEDVPESGAALEAMLAQGMTTAGNTPVLPAYVDLLVAVTPILGPSLRRLFLVMIQALHRTLLETTNENSFIAYLRGVQHVYLVAFPAKDGPALTGRAASGSSGADEGLGLVQYVSGVFASPLSSSGASNSAQPTARSPSHLPWLLEPAIATFSDLVMMLLEAARMAPDRRGPRDAFRRLDRLAKHVATAIPRPWIEAVIAVWSGGGCTLEELLAVSHTEMEALCTTCMSSILMRFGLGSQAPMFRPLTVPILFDALLALTAHSTAHYFPTWTALQQFVRDYLSIQPNALHAPLIKLAAAYCSALCGHADRRISKDVVDLFQKVVDALNATLVASIFQVDAAPGSPVKPSSSKSRLSNLVIASASADAIASMAGPDYSVESLLAVTRDTVLLAVRDVLRDQDRAAAAYSNLVYYVVQPALKQPALPTYRLILSLMDAIAAIPWTARAWKREIWDHFLDYRFFPLASDAFPEWCALLGRGYAQDPDRVTDLVTRLAAPVTNLLFSSRDHEVATRCQLVRRLSVLLWAGDMDRHLPAMPLIQERIVNLLALGSGDLFYELFLLVRIMILRFSAQHLSSLWPILIADMVRVLQSVKTTNDGAQAARDDVVSLLAVFKLLDLVVGMQFADFQVYTALFWGDPPNTGLVDAFVASFSDDPYPASPVFAMATSLAGHGDRRAPELATTNIVHPSELTHFARSLLRRARDPSLVLKATDTDAVQRIVVADLVQAVTKRGVSESK